MEENRIELLVKKIAEQMQAENRNTASGSAPMRAEAMPSGKITVNEYPLSHKRPDLVKSATGKKADEITLQRVVAGDVKPEDIRISAEVLEYQAQIAESNGKHQFAMNLRRAAEMTRIPDEKVLEVYELLRPRRATKEQLLNTARELEENYGAKITAKLIREAAEVYADRRILRQ